MDHRISLLAKNLINYSTALKSGEKINYDKLVLAQGASPIIPPFERMDKTKVFSVRTLNDADKIKNNIFFI